MKTKIQIKNPPAETKLVVYGIHLRCLFNNLCRALQDGMIEHQHHFEINSTAFEGNPVFGAAET